MSSSGDLEHVPLKVVPMYVESPEPDSDEPEASEEQEAPELQVQAYGRWRPIVGVAALLLAVATAVVHGVAVDVASNGDGPGGTMLAYVAIGLSVLTVVVGLVALIFNLGRRTGATAIVLGVLANPVVLLAVLRWFGGPTS